jgi:hypothetical protein
MLIELIRLFQPVDEVSTIQKRKACLNPDLEILSDEIVVRIEKFYREVEQHILFRSQTNVKEYRFKFFWTESSQDVKIECRPFGGALSLDPTLHSRALRWQMCILHFAEPMRRGQTKTVGLRYILPDPGHSAEPYQLITYSHVRHCEEFMYYQA